MSVFRTRFLKNLKDTSRGKTVCAQKMTCREYGIGKGIDGEMENAGATVSAPALSFS